MRSTRELYLDLMKRCLTNTIYRDRARDDSFDAGAREVGRDWPSAAHTMIGTSRLDNLQTVVEKVLANNVPGDFIETGVWRGGASIFMRAVLKAHQITNRTIWVADSFAGLPPPDPKHAADVGDQHHKESYLAVSLEEVQENFRRYDLLDDQVQFLKGWFSETLARAPIPSLAVLRLDGDMYGSTIDALDALYPKVSVGGYVIVDDYGALAGCRQATEDFRRKADVRAPLVSIDWTGAFWQKETA